MLVQVVNTLVGAGSREKCRFQWLSEQGQRCRRTDCFRKAVPNWSRGSRESSVTDGGSNSPRNDQCSGRRGTKLATSYEEVGDVAKSARKLRGTGPSGIWP